MHRALLEEALVPLGFIVLASESGADCLSLAARSKPDLFLIDLAMPGMDGWELARRLRVSGHRTACIVIVSANAGELRRPLDEASHHDAVIPKPIDFQLLLDTIATQMGLSWTSLHAPEHGGRPMLEETAAGIGLAPPVALSTAQVAHLRDLALIGYVRGIRTQLDEMEAEDPQSAPAVATLRALVAQFRLDGFMAALDRMPAAPP